MNGSRIKTSDINMEDWQILNHFWFTAGEHDCLYKTVTTLSGKFVRVNDSIEYHKKVIARLNCEL